MNELAIIKSAPPKIDTTEQQTPLDLNQGNNTTSKMDTQVDLSTVNSQ